MTILQKGIKIYFKIIEVSGKILIIHINTKILRFERIFWFVASIMCEIHEQRKEVRNY